MDNLTHSLVGAALAETGPRRRWALATPTLILAANVPDVDVASYLIADEFAALAWRRGITHGVPALIVWPFLVTGLLLAWDHLVRRRRDPDAPPARPVPLLVLAAVGTVTHPVLDWLNTYGMRWWLPFDDRWSYGDAVFIIDPWLWLGLGGAVFLARSRSRKGLVAWAALAAVASLLVLGVDMVPASAKAVWAVGIIGLAAARWLAPRRTPSAREGVARVAVACALAYVLAMVGTAVVAEREARADAAALGLEVVDVMTGPRPARFGTRDVIVVTPDEYRLGSWSWTSEPRLALASRTPRRTGPEPIIERALDTADARHFLVWSRYPYVHALRSDDGWRVRVGDVRYPGRGLGGLEIPIAE